jgi:tRNA (uracil-5-)-methyltransferase TRM9
MRPEIAAQLIAINRRFYREVADEFAETRRRIQPGVARVLAGLPDRGDRHWLDLGCGSGWLAVEWLRAYRKSAYTGLDFSPELLDEARRQLDEFFPGASGIDFRCADFSTKGWETGFESVRFSGAVCFAVLHHLPGSDNRTAFLRAAASLIEPGSLFWVSVWQFQHSPRMMARQVSWQRVGLRDDDVESGDTLLDWRHTPGKAPALRYVHRFDRGGLSALAENAGLQVLETFESDGQGGRLGLYAGCKRL